ncbi:MAG: coenzyme F420-0:L-glutamate ligase [Anaerolineae bacterium]|nr:coenzyme F420-0:L-glutamate ligase [Candidatus Roseilinea sp.]MDW8451433.1 coenzyme F420-0:L-glutamate ligase [Anaerolineae bacterium]
MTHPALRLFPIAGLPVVRPGDDLAGLLATAIAPLQPRAGDVLAVTSKIVAKAEGRFVNLREVTPSARAVELAAITQKDPRLVEVILRESSEVSRVAPNVLVTRHRLGFVSANAAIDHSNVSPDPDVVLLMPDDPDASARCIRDRLSATFGFAIPVVICDSHGRPHRLGTVGVAVGVAGMPGIEDWRGREDLFGYKLQHTEIGLADMVASAATLVMGQAAEGVPAVLVRGLRFMPREGSAAEIIRPAHLDLYH